MQNNQPMTEWFTRYGSGTLERGELETLIFTHLRKNAQAFRVRSWGDEEWQDYLCWLYPRIKKAIDAYRERGSSFDAYIASLVRWSIKEYRSREADMRVFEGAYWTARSEDAACDEEAEYDELCSAPAPAVGSKRQILILALKCYLHVSPDFSARIARALDMEQGALKNLMDRVAEKRARRDLEIHGLTERIAAQFYRCIAYENRWAAAPEGSAHRAEMQRRLEKARGRLQSMRRRLAGCRLEASNKIIAEVLGIPKGTVDSNLHSLKWKWKAHWG